MFTSFTCQTASLQSAFVPHQAHSAKLAIIISYPTSTSGIIVLLKTPTKYREFFPTLFVICIRFNSWLQSWLPAKILSVIIPSLKFQQHYLFEDAWVANCRKKAKVKRMNNKKDWAHLLTLNKEEQNVVIYLLLNQSINFSLILVFKFQISMI